MLYNYLDPQGNITNNPWSTGADGRMIDNTYQGRADGWEGGTVGLGMGANAGTGNAPQNYQTMNIPTPSASGANGFGQGGSLAATNAMQGPKGQLAPGSMNPFLGQMGSNLSDQMQKTFNRTTLPGIASGAAAGGGYGSSRQGVLEANALNDFTTNQGAALTNLFGQGYSQGLNYDLGVRNNNTANAANSNQYDLGMRNSANQYDLGLRNNDLAYAGLDRQINNDNLNWQLQGAQLGLQGNQALQGGNALGQTAAGNIQNTPLNYWQQFSNVANGFGQGYSTTTGTTQQQGSPLMGALGGAQLGSSLWKQYNGTPTSPNAAGGANSAGFGTGAGFGNQDLGAYF